jgi:hypothetical protein
MSGLVYRVRLELRSGLERMNEPGRTSSDASDSRPVVDNPREDACEHIETVLG